MKVKIANDNKKDQKLPTIQEDVRLDIPQESGPPEETLSSLCCELGTQLTMVLLISFFVCIVCFLFALGFYHIVLTNYGL